jgi:hypothetical protein
MYPDHIWQREILEQTRKRRSCVVKLVLPLVLTAPLLLPSVPPSVRGNAFVLLLIFIGIFGAAIGLIRTRESGMMARIAVLPVSPIRMTGEYLLAHTLFDSLQFFVPLILIAAPWKSDLFGLILLGVTFLMVILGSAAIGAMVAVVAGSSGEGHLFAILSVLGVVAVSGLFRDGVVGFTTGAFLPFVYLRDVLMTGTTSPYGIVLSLISGLALVAVALLFSPRLVRMT